MISLYIQGNTWAHRLPAGLKLLLVAIGSLLLFRTGNAWVFLACLAVLLGSYASLGREGLAQIRLLRGMSVFFAVILLLHWYSGSVTEGLIVVLRLMVMVLAANLVSVTTRMDDMLDAIYPIFRPLGWFGLSPRVPALGITLILRFAPHMVQIFLMLQEAYQARTGHKLSWRLITPFALQALKMSENVSDALISRGGSKGLT